MIVQDAKAWVAGFLVGVTSTVPLQAVLFESTSNTAYNTTAPTGTLTGSGWQHEGTWGSFLGTPIAPNYFITAKHVGGTNGQEFVLNGFTYHAIASFANPDSDLQIWKVAETFPAFAPLYSATNEANKHLVVFGRGTQRGDEIIVDGELKGWKWGPGDGVQRWGKNDVAAVVDGGTGLGDLLAATFDRGTGANDAHLSNGDSGGAVFIQDGATWKLAGINYSVTEPFVSTNGVDGSGFNAALLDYGGLYVGGDTDWAIITNEVDDIPSAFFSTRISANLAWIYGVLQQLTGLAVTGPNVQINFCSVPYVQHRIEYKNDLAETTWTILTNNIAGTGNIVSITDSNAATLPKRFYRVGLVQ